MASAFRPDRRDLQIIGYHTGRVLSGLGLFMVLPAGVALVLGRWNDLSAIVVGIAVTVLLGGLARWRLPAPGRLEWSHGMVTVAVGWLLGALVYAVPLHLSGHYAGPLDAVFDAMSGLTTSGLTLIQDLDHLSVPMSLLRQLSHFAGGQGIVIVVLSVLGSSSSQIGTLYVGEAREERILPNVIRTARFIFIVAFAYLAVGTAALFATGLVAGLSPWRSLYHGLAIFVAAFDTGGFAPYSTSIAYYHAPALELVVAVLMVAGALSFGLHYQLWRGRHREITENLELRTLAVTLGLTALIALVGLARAGTFTDAAPLLRQGLFTILSAHTGTGFAVTAGRLHVTDWGTIAPAAVVIAMGLGAMASSTAGGIKAIRVGLAAKAVLRDIRRALAPDAAVVVATRGSRSAAAGASAPRRLGLISDHQFRGAITILVLFLLTYLGGAVVGVMYGVPFESAMFESTSATANVGLSVGVLHPGAASALKFTYLVQMWLGRLEFMAVFVLVGYLATSLRARA